MNSLVSKQLKSGFTLLEILLVIAILGVISALGSYYLVGYKSSTEIDETANQIVGKLRETQAKAMTGEDNLSWGVHFDNTDANDPYYEIFSGAAYPGTIVEKIYLKSFAPDMKFQTPTSGNSINIIFSKISGSPGSQQSIVVYLSSLPDATKTIVVETSGRIGIQ